MADDHRVAQTRRVLGPYLLIVTLGRAVINVPFRIVYPFLPAIARGLGVSLAAASGLITLRLVGRLGSPFLGPLADRLGRRHVMAGALLLFASASLLLAGTGTLAGAAFAFLLYGIAKALYDPAVYAYLGDTVAYLERGRAIGTLELSWSSAWLLGVPVSGFLIERLGWRAPWAILIFLGLLGAWVARAGLPATSRCFKGEGGGSFVDAVLTTWRGLLRRRSVLIFLLINLLLTLAVEIPFIVYGAWLEKAFGLSLTALGLASTVVGLAEATAEFGTAVITDRLGKRRSVLMGLLGLAASLVALPWLVRFGLATALTGVALMMLTFEFAWVSLMPLATELAPDARATLISLTAIPFSFGRILGAMLGGWLWQWQSIALHAGAGSLCALVAMLLLTRGVKEVGGRREGVLPAAQ